MPVWDGIRLCEGNRVPLLPWPFGAHFSRIKIKDNTHHRQLPFLGCLVMVAFRFAVILAACAAGSAALCLPLSCVWDEFKAVEWGMQTEFQANPATGRTPHTMRTTKPPPSNYTLGEISAFFFASSRAGTGWTARRVCMCVRDEGCGSGESSPYEHR